MEKEIAAGVQATTEALRAGEQAQPLVDEIVRMGREFLQAATPPTEKAGISLGQFLPGKPIPILKDGKEIGNIGIIKVGNELQVTWLGDPKNIRGLTNEIGPTGLRSIAQELKNIFAEAKTLTGTRIGGTAEKAHRPFSINIEDVMPKPSGESPTFLLRRPRNRLRPSKPKRCGRVESFYRHRKIYSSRELTRFSATIPNAQRLLFAKASRRADGSGIASGGHYRDSPPWSR